MKIHSLQFREEDRQRFDEIKIGIEKIVAIYHWKAVEDQFLDVDLNDVMSGVAYVAAVVLRYNSYPGYSERIRVVSLLGFRLV